MTPRRNLVLTSISLAVALLIAGCTAPNTAPTVTILSPTDASTVFVGTETILTASANDAEDGDLSGDVQWSSDIDGALSPVAGGAVVLSIGAHALTATVGDSAGLSASDSVSIEVVAPKSTHLITEGLNVHLVYVDGGSLVEVDSASLPATGLLPEHAIFNVVKHPSQPWFYAASMNDCGIGDNACWGNGRIDRFVVENDSIRHDGAAFLYDIDQVDVSCTQDASSNVGQVGACAPNGMVFSPDGTRFYVDDDDLDGVHIFSVDAAGDLTFLSEGGTTSAHGLTIDVTGTYLYNGSSVIEVTGDVATDIPTGVAGNSTTLVDLSGQPGLISTTSTEGVAVYDLLDPEAPSEVDALIIGSNKARALDFVPSLETIVVVGMDTVQTVSFDGATLSLVDTYTATDTLTTQYRGVALNGDATAAIAAWFQTQPDDTFTGGAHLFSIAADGSLTRADVVEYGGRATTVLRVR